MKVRLWLLLNLEFYPQEIYNALFVMEIASFTTRRTGNGMHNEVVSKFQSSGKNSRYLYIQ